MSYYSRRADLTEDEDLDWLRDLHRYTFGDSAPMLDFDYGAWWLVFRRDDPEPAGFGGIVPSDCDYGPGFAYLKRAGVVHDHRGHGLQRRLLRIREAYARREGYHTILTETRDNPQSANNLIKAGYQMWDPPTPWALAGSLYWRKLLCPSHRLGRQPQVRRRSK